MAIHWSIYRHAVSINNYLQGVSYYKVYQFNNMCSYTIRLDACSISESSATKLFFPITRIGYCACSSFDFTILNESKKRSGTHLFFPTTNSPCSYFNLATLYVTVTNCFEAPGTSFTSLQHWIKQNGHWLLLQEIQPWL